MPPEVAAKCEAAKVRYKATGEVTGSQLARALMSEYSITVCGFDTIRRWLEQ